MPRRARLQSVVSSVRSASRPPWMSASLHSQVRERGDESPATNMLTSSCSTAHPTSNAEQGRGAPERSRASRGPDVLEAQIADAGGGIRGFLRREGPGLNRAPGHERIGEERQLMAPREVEAVVIVAYVLDQRSEERET